MGEVYRALDSRLNRTVAVKVLAGKLSSSPELKQRLEREARAISALNHPSICHLYDIGSQDGTDYLVMEFLEGETLAARLGRGPVPQSELLKIGIAIADALAFAHRQAIIHRDLKPGNIMLTKGGAKLMDFGLAKPLGAPGPQSGSSGQAPPSFTAAPTVSGPSPLSPLTAAGSIVGTVQYMSPEQIEGREADARSDIFAFGAVLYEMVTGSRPFQGRSQISLASAILEKDPEPIAAVKPDVPPALEHVVSVCLQKNPDERFQTADDVKLELQWIASGKSAAAVASSPLAPPPSLRRERLAWALALVAVALLGMAAAKFLLHSAPSVRLIRTAINPPEKTTLNLAGDAAGPPVLSPDGASIAFTATGADGRTLIWVRPLDSAEAHSLPGTEGTTFPFWSPDSRSLGFFSSGKLKTIDLSGGVPQVICDVPLGRGGAWGLDGVIVYSSDATSPLSRVKSAGGTPAPLTALDPARHTSHRWPFFLPDGRHFVYLAMNHDASKSANDTIYYASADGRENRPLMSAHSNAVYADGFLLFARGDQLLAQPFDPQKGALSGEPRTVTSGVMNDGTTWHMDASASGDGLLVYAAGLSADVQLVWLDRTGKQVGVAADKLGDLYVAVLSPRGDRAALQINAGVSDIWALDLVRGVRTRLTFGPVANLDPVWSPDGQWIAYASQRGAQSGIFRKHSDGSGVEELLYTEGTPIVPSDWSRDGRYIVGYHIGQDAGGIWALPIDGERKPRRLIPRGALPALSPDGHWLAYDSAESGAREVYVTGFEGAQGKWQVSAHGGYYARWSRDGKEFYYLDATFNLWAVPVKSAGGALQFGTAQLLAPTWSAPNMFYSISTDGKRILVAKAPQQVSQSMTLISDFRSQWNPK